MLNFRDDEPICRNRDFPKTLFLPFSLDSSSTIWFLLPIPMSVFFTADMMLHTSTCKGFCDHPAIRWNGWRSPWLINTYAPYYIHLHSGMPMTRAYRRIPRPSTLEETCVTSQDQESCFTCLLASTCIFFLRIEADSFSGVQHTTISGRKYSIESLANLNPAVDEFESNSQHFKRARNVIQVASSFADVLPSSYTFWSLSNIAPGFPRTDHQNAFRAEPCDVILRPLLFFTFWIYRTCPYH